jgi:cytochrome b6-f complex iron-sulfur subunit
VWILLIAIVLVVALGAVVVFAAARTRRESSTQGSVTGSLSAETKQRDASGAEGAADTASDEARERADETRQAIGSGSAVPARRDAGTVAERIPVDEEELGVSRRQFFNRGILITMGLSAGVFAAAAISFLFAPSAGGFGGLIDPGIALPDVLSYVDNKKEPYYVPAARTYLQPYPVADVPKAKKVPQYTLIIPNLEKGIVALYQKCVHLGCRVPWCDTSQWFECPCHGFEVQPGRREEGWPGTAWPRPVLHQHQGRRLDGHRHRERHRRPADRHRHDRAGGRRASVRDDLTPHMQTDSPINASDPKRRT